MTRVPFLFASISWNSVRNNEIMKNWDNVKSKRDVSGKFPPLKVIKLLQYLQGHLLDDKSNHHHPVLDKMVLNDQDLEDHFQNKLLSGFFFLDKISFRRYSEPCFLWCLKVRLRGRVPIVWIHGLLLCVSLRQNYWLLNYSKNRMFVRTDLLSKCYVCALLFTTCNVWRY